MAAPIKAVGPKSDKILRNAVMLAINREDNVEGKKVKRINRVADAIVRKAIDGDVPAIKEIWDRIEGKSPQPVTGNLTLTLGALVEESLKPKG